jgi:adenylate cyclase
MERRLAAILAADVAGYSHIVEVNDEASTATLRSYVAVVEEAVLTHRGRVFSRSGDGLVAEFPSIVEAIRCAVEIQHEVSDRNEAVSDDRRMQFRIGVNLGDVIAEENDLYGTGVNVAARLEQLAEPGGVCISQTVYDQVCKIVELSFEDIGAIRLKNITDPVRVYRVLARPLPRFKRLISYARRHPHLSAAVGVALLLVTGTIYLDRVPDWWRNAFGARSGVQTDRPSIAVLPFKNVSSTTDDDYFSDGLTEDITSELARFKTLFVIASNSAFTYKNRPAKAQDVGLDLGVEYLLEGTVRRERNRVRLTAQLVDSATGRQLWSDRYDRDGTDIFSIQDGIVTAIVTRLNLAVDTTEGAKLMTPGTGDASAYDHYLLGRQKFNTYTQDGFEAAKREFSEATRIDPTFAQAYGWKGYVYLAEVQEGWATDVEANLDLALQLASKGVELAPDDYYTHWNLASIYVGRKNMQMALEEYNRALALNPNDADMLAEMADMLSYQGDADKAIEQIKRAMKLNPRYPDWYDWSLGFAYFQDRQYTQAVTALQRIADPPNDAYLLLVASQAMLGQATPPRDEIMQRLLSKGSGWTLDYITQLPFTKPEDRQHYLDALRKAGIS